MLTMKNCWKKVLAYVCALVLIVTSITVYQADVSADVDYSTLTFTTLTCDNGPELNYCIVEQSIVGWSNAPFYGDGGNTFQPIYAGDGVNETADTKVSINGVDTAAGSGAFTMAASGIVKINPNLLPDNAYSTVEITTTTGEALIVFKKGTPTSGGAAEPETTTAAQVNPSDWADGSEAWTTNGVWNIWTGNGAVSRYKGNNTLNDYTINIIKATGDWSVQTNTVYSGLTKDKMYNYTITIESDKDGASVGAKEEYSNSPLKYVSLVNGENKITGTFKAVNTSAKLFLEMGNAANSGATFHITGVEITDYVENDSEGIPEGAKWQGWFEAEGWGSYPISEGATGYTLTDKNIGENWYSIQTGIDEVKFKAGVEYKCSFTLTATQPKAFKVDNRTNDAKVFEEATPGTWVDNGNGTYSYKYAGTYKNTTSTSQLINIRIALGCFAEDTNYEKSSNLTCTVSDFKIERADGSSTPVETTTSGSENETSTEAPTTAPVQKEQSEATEAAAFADLMNEGFLAGDTGAGQYKATCGKGTISSIVNIQQFGAAREYGIYVRFKDANIGKITINGVDMDVFQDGAGIIMYLSNFKYMYSDVVITNGDGTAKATVYVYNSKGIDNSDKAITPETTKPSTGEANIELEKINQFSVHVNYGSYKIMITPGKEVHAGVNAADRDHIRVKNTSGPGSDAPNAQSTFDVSRTFKGLIPGTKYVLSVDITPDVAHGSYRTIKDADWIPIKAGTTTVSMISTAYELNGAAQADFTIKLDKLGSDVTLDIKNPQYRVATDEDLTTAAPTEKPTEAPTVAPTTKAPTTTVEPTTKAPTTTVAPTTKAPTTTVAPTTKAPEKVKAPGKAKVSKVYAKKLSSKKIKLTIKKVSKAKGYQVAVYKSKKTAKKDTKASKALVKKYTTKVKYTVNSKNVKNKKKLYVKVRAYVLKGKTKVYGKWSDIKTVKVK